MLQNSSPSNPEVDELEAFLALPDPTTADIPQELIWHIAAGLEDPEIVAKRFGYEGQTWEKLKANKPFQVAVAAQASEFEANGMTFKNKSKLIAADLLERLYALARHRDTSIVQLHDIFKTITKLADLEPKSEKNAAADTGPRFSININLNGAPPQTIDITPEQIEGSQ
jgi:hypothetical protein